MLTIEEKKDFISIPSRSLFNPYLTRHFFMFLFEMVKLIKASLSDNYYKVESQKTLKTKLNIVNYMEDNLVITQIIQSLKNINDTYKGTPISQNSINIAVNNMNNNNTNNNIINMNSMNTNTTSNILSKKQDKVEKKEVTPEEILAYKDIIMFSVNIMMELITQIPGN